MNARSKRTKEMCKITKSNKIIDENKKATLFIMDNG
mgnify:CR=1 FL=1